MSTDAAVRRAFERHETYADADEGFVVETTVFDSRVVIETSDETVYTLTIRTPTLASAVEEDVGDNLLDGWFETFERRVADASKAVRADIELTADVHSEEGEAIVTLQFPFEKAERAPAVVQAMTEYVEGTYVEGVVPGFTYRPPVSGLLANATHSEETDHDQGGGPLPL
ncbi:DUF5813 family protein [Halocatena pleomorpha]|uniref:YbjN domain-containing protein n=1 Tax=Halocatena pleomorpha TaxID=1785090 RepID=A0A3P3RHL8_9EURY|nr:DUF5813 family protein [Halocatena pleomorpha]RRJ32369.1 hypothetical protein EIK79_05120 [Halocatena pleomorpha]